MRLDRARFVIRPRGILESLDLAFLFCNQHWWGLLPAAACGIIPAMAFNIWVSSHLESPQFLILILMILESPWVTVFITLYLGQITFTERFSTRLAWRMFWRSWMKLFVFQTVIRNILMVTWILAPVAYVALYYINHVILLEQTKLFQTWQRRTALNSRNLRGILQLAFVELAVLALGIFVGSQILGAVSALWRDQFSLQEQFLMMQENPWNLLRLERWETQLACWMALSFVTVWRYATYLDCRVRREGWDVELQMRDQALAYQSWGAVMRGLLLIVALTTLAFSPALAIARDPQSSTIHSQRTFPWYDKEKQAYHPLTPPVPDLSTNSTNPFFEWLFGGTEGKSTAGGLIRICLLLLVAAVLGWLGYLFFKSLDFERSEDNTQPEIPSLDTAQLEALPSGVRKVTDFIAEAQRLAQSGDFNSAMIFYYSWQLVTLDRAGIVELEVGKINRQYVRETIQNCPELRELFQKSTRLFEDAFYGNVRLESESFERLWQARDEFRKSPLKEGRRR